MSEKKQKDEEKPAEVEELNVNPISDDDLERVSGGGDGCSCNTTTGSCTGSTAVIAPGCVQ